MKFFKDIFTDEEKITYGYHPSVIGNNGGFNAFKLKMEDEVDTEESPLLYIGIELECGTNASFSNNDYHEIEKYVYDNFPCILEHDSSIGTYHDMEIISQPMSWRYWNEVAFEQLKNVTKYLASKGFESHNLGTCGLHIHYTLLDKPHKVDIVNRLWEQIHTFESETHKVAGRSYVHYASDLDCSDAIVPQEKLSISYINDKCKAVWNNPHSYHGLVINVQHENDIEIRMCKGTLNFDTLAARMEYFYNMYNQACDLKTIVQRMTWGKLVRGKYIKAYIQRQSIATNKKVYDYSTKVQVLYRKLHTYEDKVITEIVKVLKECKKVKNDQAKMQELSITYELNDIIPYLTNALSSLTNRLINDSQLSARVKRYMTTYAFDTIQGKEFFRTLLRPLSDLLSNKPSLEMNDPLSPQQDI